MLRLAAEARPSQRAILNRALLEESFPVALGTAALAVADAAVQLTRCHRPGRIAAHRLSASDSIMADFAIVDEVQDGCVRFSAYAHGSVVPRPYKSATMPPGAPIFTSNSYGQPGYAQLLETADDAIVGGAAGASISAGAETGSEMGAFSADRNPVKEAGPARQIRRVHAARAHARDRACHVIIALPGAGRGRRPWLATVHE